MHESEWRSDLIISIRSPQEHEQLSYSSTRTKAPSVIISGLKPATWYIFSVRTRTPAGYSSYSPKYEYKTTGDCKFLSNFPHCFFSRNVYVLYKMTRKPILLCSRQPAVTTTNSPYAFTKKWIRFWIWKGEGKLTQKNAELHFQVLVVASDSLCWEWTELPRLLIKSHYMQDALNHVHY